MAKQTPHRWTIRENLLQTTITEFKKLIDILDVSVGFDVFFLLVGQISSDLYLQVREVAQEADEDEDYDSEDEEKMLQRYAKRCNAEVTENLRSILMQFLGTGDLGDATSDPSK